MKRFLYAFSLAALVFAADQASKWFMLESLRLHETQPIEITSFFNLAFVWNRGVSFGMFAEHNQPVILSTLSLVIVAILLAWLAKTRYILVSCSLGLVIGGALGNLVDRLRYGAVADFLDFHLQNLHWPAFNIADSAIFIGVVLLCAEGMFTGRKTN